MIDLDALPAPQGSGAVNAGRFDLALKALGGVWSACVGLVEVLSGLCGGLVGGGGRVRQMGGSVGIICLLPAACCATYDFY